MGLDMYLKAKIYISKYADLNTSGVKAEQIRKLFTDVDTFDDSSEVTFKVGYWRKANAIHKWFVDNVQDGEDDCGTYSVSREALRELRELCKEVIRTKDTTKLSTQSGFFFGGTEYDEFYFEDLKTTIDIIERCLKMSDDWDFEYHSSW